MIADIVLLFVGFGMGVAFHRKRQQVAQTLSRGLDWLKEKVN